MDDEAPNEPVFPLEIYTAFENPVLWPGQPHDGAAAPLLRLFDGADGESAKRQLSLAISLQ